MIDLFAESEGRKSTWSVCRDLPRIGTHGPQAYFTQLCGDAGRQPYWRMSGRDHFCQVDGIYSPVNIKPLNRFAVALLRHQILCIDGHRR